MTRFFKNNQMLEKLGWLFGMGSKTQETLALGPTGRRGLSEMITDCFMLVGSIEFHGALGMS